VVECLCMFHPLYNTITGDDANLGNTIEIRLTSTECPYWIASPVPKVGFHTVSA
jgi:hypothetical protein